MKNEYFNKQEFIKDFIALCRGVKRENNNTQPGFLHKFFSVCGELWSFCIYIDNDTLSTSAELILDGRPLKFPKTTWGGPYSRWDSELREFLRREICK